MLVEAYVKVHQENIETSNVDSLMKELETNTDVFEDLFDDGLSTKDVVEMSLQHLIEQGLIKVINRPYRNMPKIPRD